MASNKKSEETIVDVADVYSKSESFINKNGKSLTTIFGIAVLAILAFFLYKKFVDSPKAKEASNEIWKAEYYLEKDSLDKALFGDGQYLGFEDIASDYSGTPSGNLANHYAGIIYMQKGEYGTAVDFLKKAEFDDIMLESERLGAVGDAYSQLGEYDNAATWYAKSISYSDNEFTAPIYLKKLGLVYEELGQTGKAYDTYSRLKEDFSASTSAKDIEKYIGRVSAGR